MMIRIIILYNWINIPYIHIILYIDSDSDPETQEFNTDNVCMAIAHSQVYGHCH